ncbi:hypothetical protein V8C34DRAFT_257787 [Trichoderma compactum]
MEDGARGTSTTAAHSMRVAPRGEDPSSHRLLLTLMVANVPISTNTPVDMLTNMVVLLGRSLQCHRIPFWFPNNIHNLSMHLDRLLWAKNNNKHAIFDTKSSKWLTCLRRWDTCRPQHLFLTEHSGNFVLVIVVSDQFDHRPASCVQILPPPTSLYLLSSPMVHHPPAQPFGTSLALSAHWFMFATPDLS